MLRVRLPPFLALEVLCWLAWCGKSLGSQAHLCKLKGKRRRTVRTIETRVKNVPYWLRVNSTHLVVALTFR